MAEKSLHEHRIPQGPLKSTYDYNPNQTVSMEFGFILVLTGILGVFWPTFMSLNLSPMHCLVLATAGVLSVWSGLTTNKKTTYRVQLGLGFFFLLHVIVGIAVGEPGNPSFYFYTEEQLSRMAPGFLELSTVDHVVHGLLSVVFFSEALIWRQYVKGKDIDLKSINLRKKSISRTLKIFAFAAIIAVVFFVVDQVLRSS